MRGVPAVKKYYEDFKADERFNMIAVSLDSDLEMWRKTIQARKMTWANLCDGKGWKTKYAKK